jgi:hypothetical protein
MALTSLQREVYHKILENTKKGLLSDRFLFRQYKGVSFSVINALIKKGLIEDAKPNINCYERRLYRAINRE